MLEADHVLYKEPLVTYWALQPVDLSERINQAVPKSEKKLAVY